jgi:hypothetical protein
MKYLKNEKFKELVRGVYMQPFIKKQIDEIVNDVNAITDGSVAYSTDNGDAHLKWKINPKCNLNKLDEKGIEAFGKTSLHLEFDKDFKDTDVSIQVKIGGNLEYTINSDKGSAYASFVATKRF